MKIIYKLNGTEVTPEVFARHGDSRMDEMLAEGQPPALGGNTPACWPMKSEAMAVHPDQIPEALARNKRHGISGVSYDRLGRAVLADRRARRDLMRLEGVHDNQGGYGDDHAATPQDPLPDNPISPEV